MASFTSPVTAQGRILVVDDEANARNALAEILREEGYGVETAADGFKGLARFREFLPDLVFTDLKMPGMDGVELLSKVRELEPAMPVVVMTAYGAVDTAVRAMRSGAIDYLTKPINTEELLLVAERALEQLHLRREAQALRNQLAERYRFENVVGSSPRMQQVFKMVAQVAPSRATVLLTGESGTGKELLAAAIHHRSKRASGPFVKLHCAGLAENLLEGELFGDEREAAAGTPYARGSRFERASGGTLFLDEVAEISAATQVKLLRVLQEHEFERAGGHETIAVDTRVIAATHRDLRGMVADGTFREDLFYRLNVIHVALPALRERSSDIPGLAQHFLRRFASENAKSVERISDAALARLVAYSWPGNVRELENVMERAVVLADGPVVDLPHLPLEVQPTVRRTEPVIPGSTMAELERYAILTTLEAQRGSTSRAAEVLGISVRKIQYKLQEYGNAQRSGVPALSSDEPR
jgi:two-component system response regulator HydG